MEILVDFDGTLVDSLGCWIEVYKQFCRYEGFRIRHSIITTFKIHGYKAMIKKIAEKHRVDNVVERLRPYAEMVYCLRPPKGNVLRYLLEKSDLKITIVSREEVVLIEKWLEHYAINFVDEIKTLGKERLNPSLYNNDVVLVDDSAKYLEPASMAGAYTIGIYDHHNVITQKKLRLICNEYWED